MPAARGSLIQYQPRRDHPAGLAANRLELAVPDRLVEQVALPVELFPQLRIHQKPEPVDAPLRFHPGGGLVGAVDVRPAGDVAAMGAGPRPLVRHHRAPHHSLASLAASQA